MNQYLKWIIKVSFTAILWVFILSVRWQGQPLFNHAHDVLVDNSIVRAVDEQLADLWWRLSQSAKSAVSGESPRQDDKAL